MSRKRCSSVSDENDETRPTSPKRNSVSPEIQIKQEKPSEEPSSSRQNSPPMTSPTTPQEEETIQDKEHLSYPIKLDAENLHSSLHRIQHDMSTNPHLRPIELLMKIFPDYNPRTLELFLQSCRDNLVETIECILSAQRSCHAAGGVNCGSLRPPTLNGCTMPTMTHASPFLHSPLPRDPIGRQLPNPHSCPSTRIYQPLPLPPPLLIKPKPESHHFRHPSISPTLPRAPSTGLSERNGRAVAMSKFCTYCGNKMKVFDKFCSHCGKASDDSSPN